MDSSSGGSNGFRPASAATARAIMSRVGLRHDTGSSCADPGLVGTGDQRFPKPFCESTDGKDADGSTGSRSDRPVSLRTRRTEFIQAAMACGLTRDAATRLQRKISALAQDVVRDGGALFDAVDAVDQLALAALTGGAE